MGDWQVTLYRSKRMDVKRVNSLIMAAKDPCKKHACEIQKCLQANNYLESRCEAVFQEMRRCCAQYPKGISLSCSGFKGEEREREKQVPDSNQSHPLQS
ncbi:cx9C motif-containing protein 4 [Crotalus tigris]|uniref:cx9C motif-containing protein 4 n=1 Tax=Crotalus tigris TaxID=88082 RepID=UPI00192F44C0|nr:cx9C motif-containing protein 4 [Crotalus tigris]